MATAVPSGYRPSATSSGVTRHQRVPSCATSPRSQDVGVGVGVGVAVAVAVGVGVAVAVPVGVDDGVAVTVGGRGGLPLPPAAPLAPAADATTSPATTTAVATTGGHDRRRAPSERTARTSLTMAAPPSAGSREPPPRTPAPAPR